MTGEPLPTLIGRLEGPANSAQCHAADYCGEPGDVHTNEAWHLSEADRDAVLALVRAATHLRDSSDVAYAIDPQYWKGVPKRVIGYVESALEGIERG